MHHPLRFVAAAIVLGGLSACVCTTAAPPPVGVAPIVEPGASEVYYEEPVAPPPAEWAENVIWFYGPHPITPGWGAGWCPINGPHTHPYEPAWSFTYYFYGGYYYYGGDPSPYGVSTVYVYGGPHPNPWGGWCYVEHQHRHFYAPRRAAGVSYRAGVYVYEGPYDDEYRRDKVYYDADGRRAYYEENGHRVQANGYHEHVDYRVAHFGGPPHLDMTHPGEGGHIEPMHGEPGHAEPGHMEPGHMDPGHMEPGHMEPGHSEPGHMEPGHMEPGHMEPGHSEPGHMDAGHGQPAHVEPAHGQPGHVEPAKGNGKVEPKKDDKDKKKKGK